MAKLISKFPPVTLLAFRTVTDLFGKKWTGAIVNPLVGAQYGIIAYRADLPGPFPAPFDYRGSYDKDIWFKCPADDFLQIMATLERSNINPRNTTGLIFKRLRVGNYSLEKISQPSWYLQILRTTRN